MGFLDYFFSTVKMPHQVAVEVVAVYGAEHSDTLCSNRSVASEDALVTQLLAWGVKKTTWARLISLGNATALETFLASEESGDVLLRAVVKRWRLTPTDQARLLDRKIGALMANRVYVSPRFTYEMRQSVKQLTTKNRKPGFTSSYRDVTRTAAVDQGRYREESREEKFAKARRLGVLDQTVATLSGEAGFEQAYVGLLGAVLTYRLGDGSGEFDVTQWMAFLRLSGNEPDVPAGEIIDAALAMARGERVNG
jgi:hypothetical protein